jgi:cobalt-zinc-cadmium efflux system outer membrane protein
MRRLVRCTVLLTLGAGVAAAEPVSLPESEQMAQADGAVPPATELPQLLSLDEALGIFRKRGLDLLIAEAALRSAEGAVKIAGAVPNPIANASVGNSFTYSTNKASLANCLQNGSVCSPWASTLGISDSAALEDTLSGKRDLRLTVARNALAAAKMSRVDAERTIAFQVKSAYAQVALAALNHRFAREIDESQATTLKKFQARYQGGAISDADLQRIEVQKLEADQALSASEQAARQARIVLAFLLGVRGMVPDFDVDTKALDYSVPAPLLDATEASLLRTAFDHRPDLIGSGYLLQQAEAQVRLVKRQRFPDITLSLNYGFGGFGGFSTNGPIQGNVITLGLSVPIPVFYGLEGELRQAAAQYDANSLQRAKMTAQVSNDVSTAFAAFAAGRKLVERMEGPRREGGGLLAAARGAFELVGIQYDKGAASLTDYLDALRTYIATKTEYFAALATYRTAVFQLEAAVARELR